MHPTFLYELLWNVLIVILLVVVDRRSRLGHGRLFALYVAGYCVGRFVIELMRSDYATQIAGIRINSFTAGIVFVLAALYVALARKGREDPSTLRSKDSDVDADAADGDTEVDERVETTDTASTDTVSTDATISDSASTDSTTKD